LFIILNEQTRVWCPSGFYIHISIRRGRDWENFFLFLQAADTIFLSNEITNWNYWIYIWGITISECILTLLICLTIFSFHYQINKIVINRYISDRSKNKNTTCQLIHMIRSEKKKRKKRCICIYDIQDETERLRRMRSIDALVVQFTCTNTIAMYTDTWVIRRWPG
jgi:hypothetical protein